MKIFPAILILISTLPSLGQYAANVDCNNVGEPIWPEYLQYRKDLANGKRFPIIREMDSNIYAIHERQSGVHHVLSKIYLRWLLTDDSIHYIIRVTDIMDETILKKKLSGCAVKIDPTLLMTQYKKDALLVNIEREDHGGLNIGLTYLFKPIDRNLRTEIFAKLEACEDMNCQIDLLMERKLYFDALSLIELSNEQNHPDKEALSRKYWEIVTFINKRP